MHPDDPIEKAERITGKQHFFVQNQIISRPLGQEGSLTLDKKLVKLFSNFTSIPLIFD